MFFKPFRLTAAAALIAAVTGGCAALPVHAPVHAKTPKAIKITLNDSTGKESGTAVFRQLAKGVLLDVSVTGLTPGKHGIHIHEIGKCVAPDFKSAGGHFNPQRTSHGFNNPRGPHAGDMPNLIAGADGRAQAEFILRAVTLNRGVPNSLLKKGGTALVVHAKADDMQSDPAGNAGSRVACVVID